MSIFLYFALVWAVIAGFDIGRLLYGPHGKGVMALCVALELVFCALNVVWHLRELKKRNAA